MALDLCLVDMAAHNQAGTYTAPRGRTYKKDKMSSLDEDTFNVAKFVFDDTTAAYQSTSDTGVTYFCSGDRYRPPQLVIDIATDPEPSVVRERHGVFFDGSSPLEDNPVAPYGKDFDDRANLPFWWSLGALGMWPLAEVSVEAGNEFRLWETSEFGDINLLASINDYDPAKIRVWEQERAAVINFGFLSEANTYAYREPKVSLASVLDHRFGEMRDQGHAWQAAIDENAMVFTTHPGDRTSRSRPCGATTASRATGPARRRCRGRRSIGARRCTSTSRSGTSRPTRWCGACSSTARSPTPTCRRTTSTRFARPATGRSRRRTAATSRCGRGARRRGASTTRRSTRPGGWSSRSTWSPRAGPDNVWIVEVGSDDGGSLDDFVNAVTAIEPSVVRDDAGFTVSWTSPSSGIVDYSSTGVFLVEGVEYPTSDHPRHESPWGGVDHLSTPVQPHRRRARPGPATSTP